MTKAYHLSHEEATLLIRDYFAQKGLNVTNVKFETVLIEKDWSGFKPFSQLKEVVVYYTEGKTDELPNRS